MRQLQPHSGFLAFSSWPHTLICVCFFYWVLRSDFGSSRCLCSQRLSACRWELLASKGYLALQFYHAIHYQLLKAPQCRSSRQQKCSFCRPQNKPRLHLTLPPLPLSSLPLGKQKVDDAFHRKRVLWWSHFLDFAAVAVFASAALQESSAVDRNVHVGSIIVDVRMCLPKESSTQSQHRAPLMSLLLHFCILF